MVENEGIDLAYYKVRTKCNEILHNLSCWDFEGAIELAKDLEQFLIKLKKAIDNA